QSTDLHATNFDKDAGSIEPVTVGGQTTRWIRAHLDSNHSDATQITRNLKIAINCFSAPPLTRPALLEGITNSTPLSLALPFYPLGRDPRIFDAFYLGWDEALSKPAATITFHFTTGENFSGPLAVETFQSGAGIAHVIAAVSKDGRLRIILIAEDGAGHPGLPDFREPTQPHDGDRPVQLTCGLRPSLVINNGPGLAMSGANAGDALVAAAAENEVWFWRSSAATDPWTSLGTPSDKAPVTDVVLMYPTGQGKLIAYAVAGGGLFQRNV